MPAANIFSPESLSASGRSSEKLSLPSLQSKMKSDPDGYLSELHLILRHFDSSLDLFRRHSSLSTSTDPSVSKELGDFAMFLAHVSPFYPGHVDEFPGKVAELLREDGRSLPSSLRCHLVQALILLINRKENIESSTVYNKLFYDHEECINSMTKAKATMRNYV